MSTRWPLEHFDLDDELNRAIWDDSPGLQRVLDERREPGGPQAVGAQALVGSPALPWVPDLVGRAWRSPDAVFIFGSSYADFFSPHARRGGAMPVHDYRARSLTGFHRSFIAQVMEGDAAYYGKVADLLDAAGISASNIVLTDLCRASFVRMEDGQANASEQVLKDHAEHFARYVEANRSWHLGRIAASRVQVIVALGRLATRGVLHLLESNKWLRTSDAGRRSTQCWILSSGPHDRETRLQHPTGRQMVVLHVPHPGAWGGACPADGAPALRRLLALDDSHGVTAREHATAVPPVTTNRHHPEAGGPWRALFRPAKPLDAAALLAQHPDAHRLTGVLLEGVSARRIIAIANAMFNPCRPSRLGDNPSPVEAWAILLKRKDTPFSRHGSKWERLLEILEPMPDWAERRIDGMNITELGSVAQALIRGPYKRA